MRIEDELNQRGTVNVAEYLGDKTFYNLPAVEFKSSISLRTLAN